MSPSEGKGTKCFGWTLQLRTREGHERKMAGDLKAPDLHNFQDSEFQLFCNRPARDEANAQSGFDGGLDRFGGIEIHHALERF